MCSFSNMYESKNFVLRLKLDEERRCTIVADTCYSRFVKPKPAVYYHGSWTRSRQSVLTAAAVLVARGYWVDGECVARLAYSSPAPHILPPPL
jgi:hypothetical protein